MSPWIPLIIPMWIVFFHCQKNSLRNYRQLSLFVKTRNSTVLLPLSSWLIDTGRSPCVLDAEAMTAHLTVIHQMVSKDTFAMYAVGHSLSFPKPYSIPQTKTLIHGPDTWSWWRSMFHWRWWKKHWIFRILLRFYGGTRYSLLFLTNRKVLYCMDGSGLTRHTSSPAQFCMRMDTNGNVVFQKIWSASLLRSIQKEMRTRRSAVMESLRVPEYITHLGNTSIRRRRLFTTERKHTASWLQSWDVPVKLT